MVKPDSSNFEYFFSVNFLQYSNALRVVQQTGQTSTLNATSNGSGLLVKNKQDYEDNYSGQGSVGTFAARSARCWGNNLLVTTCPSANAFEQTTTTSQQVDGSTSVGDTTITVDSDATNYINVGDIIEFSSTASGVDFTTGEKYRVTNVASTQLTIVQHPRGGGLISVVDNARIKRKWRYADQVDGTSGTSVWTSTRSGLGDEIHAVVVDEDGGISGVPGTVLESFSKLSKASDAKSTQGEVLYYPTVIQNKSKYVFWMDHNTSGTNWGNTLLQEQHLLLVDVPTSESLSGGG